MNRKPRDRRNRKKKFDPYLFGAERGPLGATPKGQMHKDLREMDQENMKAYEEYKKAPRYMKGGGCVMSGRGGSYKGCK